MNTLKKSLIAAVLGLSAIGATYGAASARAADEVSVSLIAQNYDRDRYDRDRYDRRGDWRRDRWDRDRVVRQLSFDTRWRARVNLIEFEFDRRGGRDRRVCEVSARGPDAYRIPNGYLRSIANRHCSRYAQIRIDA